MSNLNHVSMKLCLIRIIRKPTSVTTKFVVLSPFYKNSEIPQSYFFTFVISMLLILFTFTATSHILFSQNLLILEIH